MKKILASFLIATVLWASVIAPARAFVPLLFPYALGSITTAEGAIALSATLSTVTIGGIITSIALTSDGNEPAANGSNSAIQIQIDPYTPLTTPESATPQPTSPYEQVEEVVNQYERYYAYTCPGGACYTNTLFEACTGRAAVVSTADNTYTVNSVTETSTCNVTQSFNGQPTQLSVGSVSGCLSPAYASGGKCFALVNRCGSGYMFNSTTQSCDLTNPNQQQPDTKTQIVRQNNEFLKNPNDPDPIPENLLVRPKDIVISTPQNTTKVHINDDGTIQVTEIKPTADGNTSVEKLQLSAPGPGQAPQVLGKESQLIPGQELGKVDPGATVNSPVLPGTSSGTPTSPASGTTVLNLPSNLAKTEDVREVRDKLTETNTKLDATKDAITHTVHADAASVKGQVDTKLGNLETDIADAWQQKTDQLTGITQQGAPFTWDWSPTIPSASCSALNYGVTGHMFDIDPCVMIGRVRDIAGYVLYIITALALFSIATRKPE